MTEGDAQVHDDFGRLPLPPGVSVLLQARLGCPQQTASRWLDELVKRGLLDREGGRKGAVYALYPAARLVARLTRKPSIRTGMQQQARTPRAQAWADALSRRTTLLNEIEDSKARTAAAFQKAAAKKAGRPPKPAVTTPRALTPAEWFERFRYYIKSGIGGASQPRPTKKDFALLSRFRHEYASDDEFDRILQWFCQEANWEDLRRRCKITAEEPTVAVFYGFRGSFVKRALSGAVVATGPKRSGGAVNPVEGDTRDDTYDSF